MNPILLACLTSATILPSAAIAATIPSENKTALVERLNQLEQELIELRKQIDTMESEQKQRSKLVQSTTPAENTKAQTSIIWKGAPQFQDENGWSMKPRGRLLYDIAHLSGVPASIDIPGDGFSNEARRARLGIQGSMPGGFSYKLEVDYTSGSELNDAYLRYTDGPLKLTVGQHKNFLSLEELTSSNNSSFIERAAFTDAFGFDARLGVSATYKLGKVLLQGGVFSDNIENLSDGNNAMSVDARVTYSDTFDNALLHLGSSVHVRNLGDEIDSVRYRQRPIIHSVDTRFINTDNITGAEDELSYGLEAALIADRFHAAGETHWAKVKRTNAGDPTFFGGYLEAGYFLSDDKRQYKDGVFKAVKVKQPLSDGGLGAWQINFRFDYLDLVNEGIVGGKQNAYMASLIWTPIDYVRVLLNYGHISYTDALDIVAGAPNDFSVNVVGLRTQVSF